MGRWRGWWPIGELWVVCRRFPRRGGLSSGLGLVSASDTNMRAQLEHSTGRRGRGVRDFPNLRLRFPPSLSSTEPLLNVSRLRASPGCQVPLPSSLKMPVGPASCVTRLASSTACLPFPFTIHPNSLSARPIPTCVDFPVGSALVFFVY
ncbi:hypothetical protein M427DRAFT_462342 [Gonapodya prolifera JEL478]|uniref:Uncharacterized protein n=1 Tax=Gonapodya prolifera (strain JEL478) TaxID=1344416 RepID=A0A139A2F9_GONPJ|nr:hypothetical protein M427DRAFT_462342 [Gonapodya prolifera JEL478]|eukprot:KXS10828.1 hypothetical protein M427DRAFT_462342 [Gonapodya prolifera JEL478]